ncbi:CpsD/CapB family tyrosine-protein kinase [Clostridium chauvoei]|uniref:non-specific protein-tyrosine kinase n=3 Tax=Clostridium chauvoei TaxID=46867 RepID=S6EXD3_9CLOT|nr:CpsD/CapB family tyrosine-protein kinase [Clostridium chauvoei]ATD54277.1 capsular biosynthesis protein [Clostridium chauvoei]ATD58040.1 capsular biosynthesis protein [Clostridium chauvoei]MBX7279884.1 CpsD/CapB family tyrosine-protein kinase [Clostridium chauvoei]MBX7282198.1 CpsD/CapB family tyrosine-protein kinase [Clostridium chauvoei]MBX7284774.1 CpsD/CapB family tyrosine-protein kinase [Clostridium chauvoei]
MLVVENKPKSVIAESYRTLRTNIQYSSFDKEYKAIVITSSEPGEGKSTTAANLALSLAQGEKKVVLIDCDLRKPSIHKKFKVSNATGLSDVLIGKERLSNTLKRHGENLLILPSGKIPPNPSEMLSSKAMSNLLEELKEDFDYIIIDTPPIQAVTDSQILSTKVDGTLLVIRAKETKRESVHNAVNLLKKVNAHIMGTVLNGVDNDSGNYYYYYGEN